MLSTPVPVRAQLSEALTIIGGYDFPAKWPSLLPHLLERLSSGDLATVAGVLETANSIYKRYRSYMQKTAFQAVANFRGYTRKTFLLLCRSQMMSAELSRDLAYSQRMVQPLLQILQKLVQQLESTPSSETGVLTQVLNSIRLALRVFYSLNSPGLTEVMYLSTVHLQARARMVEDIDQSFRVFQDFENTLDAWMAEFHKLMISEKRATAPKGGDRGSLLDSVKAAVCQNINLLVSRDEEEFAKFLPTFVQDVWTQLVQVSTDSKQVSWWSAAFDFVAY